MHNFVNWLITYRVLAGDPHQLGPVTRAPIYDNDGVPLDQSIQERFLKLDAYANFEHPLRDEKYDNATLYPSNNFKPDELRMGSFLVQNYRSHKKIFEVSSVSFYRTRLVERAPESRRSR